MIFLYAQVFRPHKRNHDKAFVLKILHVLLIKIKIRLFCNQYLSQQRAVRIFWFHLAGTTLLHLFAAF